MDMYEKEQAYFRDMVQRIKDTGANLAICQWGLDLCLCCDPKGLMTRPIRCYSRMVFMQ